MRRRSGMGRLYSSYVGGCGAKRTSFSTRSPASRSIQPRPQRSFLPARNGLKNPENIALALSPFIYNRRTTHCDAHEEEEGGEA